MLDLNRENIVPEDVEGKKATSCHGCKDQELPEDQFCDFHPTCNDYEFYTPKQPEVLDGADGFTVEEGMECRPKSVLLDYKWEKATVGRESHRKFLYRRTKPKPDLSPDAIDALNEAGNLEPSDNEQIEAEFEVWNNVVAECIEKIDNLNKRVDELENKVGKKRSVEAMYQRIKRLEDERGQG